MQFSFTFQVPPLLKSVEAIRAALDNPTMILNNLGEALLRVNQERHENEQAPDGTKWQDVSALTRATKRKNRILYDHGDLLRFVYQVDGHSLRIWTADWKAKFHHLGTKPYTISPTKAKALKFGGGIIRKRVNHPGLPIRQLVGFPESDQKLSAEVVTDHLKTLLRR